MKRIAVLLLAAGLFATSLLAQEQVYLYVSYQAAVETSFRHKLDCLDTACKLEMNNTERNVRLTTEQRQRLLHALQTESKRFNVALDPVLSGKPIKIKFRYDTPTKRLEIERRLPADQPVDLTPEMLQVIKTHFELDLTRAVSIRSNSGDATAKGSAVQDPAR
jgi:hypothetical protein